MDLSGFSSWPVQSLNVDAKMKGRAERWISLSKKNQGIQCSFQTKNTGEIYREPILVPMERCFKEGTSLHMPSLCHKASSGIKGHLSVTQRLPLKVLALLSYQQCEATEATGALLSKAKHKSWG